MRRKGCFGLSCSCTHIIGLMRQMCNSGSLEKPYLSTSHVSAGAARLQPLLLHCSARPSALGGRPIGVHDQAEVGVPGDARLCSAYLRTMQELGFPNT